MYWHTYMYTYTQLYHTLGGYTARRHFTTTRTTNEGPLKSVEKFVSQVVQEQLALSRMGRKWKTSGNNDDIPTTIENYFQPQQVNR